MPRRLDQTLVDYVVIAIIPTLIMLLVGSLVFFLLTVFYSGQFEARLNWIFAWFVLAIVLIARLSMTEGIEYAALFAIPLALASGLAMDRFVQIQGPLSALSWPINWALLGVVWWSAHKLTWDCTLIDETQDATGQGLLQTVGLDQDSNDVASLSPAGQAPSVSSRNNDSTSESLWSRYVQRQRRPHAPGVWVVYFSLAAFPLFGVGQIFIPASDGETRRYAFRLLCLYVASGLSLLLTTSFLALRRYLRQRRLAMPAEMVRTWLISGTLTVIALMFLCAVLPRPGAEYSISRLPVQFRSPNDLRPSRVGLGNDGAGAEDATGTKTITDEDSSESGAAERKRSSGKDAANRSADEAPDEASSPNGNFEPVGKVPGQAESRQGDRSTGNDGGPQSSTGGSDSDRDENITDSRQSDSDSGQSQSRTSRAARDRPAAPPAARTVRAPTGITEMFTGLFKLFIYAAIIVGASVLLWQYRHEVRAAMLKFLDELRAIWGRLFGRHGSEPDSFASPEDSARFAPPRPFSSYRDPFSHGFPRQLSPSELVIYTFQAFEAWARERGCPRRPEITPNEFARTVTRQITILDDEAKQLARMYSKVAYSGATVTSAHARQLKSLWRKLTSSTDLDR